MLKKLEELRKQGLNEWIEEAFWKIQKAWNDNDLDAIVLLESGFLLERDAQRMQQLEYEGKREVRKDVVMHYVLLDEYENDGEYEIVRATVKATMEKYIYKLGTDEIVSGIRDYNMTKEYKVTVKKKHAFDSENQIVKCKACSAKVNLNASGKCEYCGTMVYSKEHDWVIEDIVQLDD